MSHPAHELLWAYARRELELEERAAVEAHLTLCHGCVLKLDEVKAAQAALGALPEVPPMPEAMARRVGLALSHEAEKRLGRRWNFWPFELSPLWVFGGAAMTAAVLTLWVVTRAGAGAIDPTVPAPGDQLAKEDDRTGPPVVLPPPPAPKLAPQKLAVSVASASKAKSGQAPLAKAQKLTEGSKVSTDKGGALWLNLPDGTRAGLTSASAVKLVTLEAKALTLDVEQGNLALVVPHREDRVLTVRAGDVSVRDLGTRFLVSRDANRVLVAVEEGSVEVTAPGHVEKVTAGHAVAWQNGTYRSLPWEVTKPAPPKPKPAAKVQETPPIPDQRSTARLSDDGDDDDDADRLPPRPAKAAAQALAEPPGSPEEEFAPMPGAPVRAAAPKPAQPGVEAASAPRPGQELPDAEAPKEPVFSLKEVERRLQELGRALTVPLVVVFQGGREKGAKDVERLADDGDCPKALERADEWLAQPAVDAEREKPLRRAVLKQKLRCFTQQGRFTEGREAQKQLDAIH